MKRNEKEETKRDGANQLKTLVVDSGRVMQR